MTAIENVWLYLRKSRSNHIKLFKDFKEALYLCSKDPTEKEMRSLWDKEKGLVTLGTFTDIVSSLPDISESELMSAFKLFDVNHDGSLSLDELAIMLTKLGDKMSNSEVKKIFEQLDVNNDSKLDYKEFCGLYTQTNKQMAHVIDHVVKSEPHKTEPKETEKEKEVEKEKKKEMDKETKKAIEKEKRRKEEEDEEERKKEKKTKLGIDPEKSIRGSKSLSDLEPKAGRLRKAKVEEKSKPKVEEEKPKKKEEEEVKPKKKEDKKKEEVKEPPKRTDAEEKANAKVSEFTSFEIEGDTTSDETTSDGSGGSDERSDESESETDTEATEKSEKPTDFHSWPNNNIRGCIYAGARGDWTTHQYTLTLSKASNVCVMISHLAQTKGPKNQADLSVYVLEKAKARYLTNKVVEGRSCFMGELAAGEYTLMPHSSSCTFVNAEVLPPTPVDVNNGSKLSTQAIKVFTDIFHCLDLNGDMLLSRQEFELFHIVSSGEPLSDAMWNVLGENFEMESDKITLAGFLKLHEMALEDTEGGEEEIRDTLSSMGYNSALQLVKACPYHIDVYSECEARVTLASLLALTNNPPLERALVGLTQQHGSEVVVGDSAVLHLYTLPWRSSAAVTNKTPTPLRIEVNTTTSENCIENPPYAKHILTVPANRTVMCHHFTPEYRDKAFLPLITIKALPPKEVAKHKSKPVEQPKPKIVEPKPEKEEIIEPKPEPEKASIDLPKYDTEKAEKKERPKSSKKGLLSKSKSSKTSKGKSKSSIDL